MNPYVPEMCLVCDEDECPYDGDYGECAYEKELGRQDAERDRVEDR